jgi:hypothetical protein
LPCFVGHGGFEADVGGLGFLLGLWRDKARLGEVATDCCWRDSDVVVGGEVSGNRVRARVESVTGEVSAELNNLVGYCRLNFSGTGVGAP